MSHILIQEHSIKQQHSQVFTIKSIDSQAQLLDIIPIYKHHSQQQNYKSGHWSPKQHIKYVMFIDYFSHIFSIKHNKKLWKIFTIMSAFIKTRNSSQCRSHHQKNEKKHQSIQQILQIQRAKYRNYNSQFQKMKKVLQKLPIHNPIQIQKQKQSTDYISSIKVLQDNLDYKVYRNSISMKNIEFPKKSLKDIKNRASQKIITYPKQKYIGSQVSIQMEDQSEQCYNQKIKSLGHQQAEQSIVKQQNIWGFECAQNYYKKDQKFDRTADTYRDQTKRPIHDQQKIQNNSLPGKQGLNSQNLQHPVDQMFRSSYNIVRMKKTRSSLPSFDILDVDQNQLIRLGKRLRNQKKNSSQSSEGKCKTLPPRSVTTESEQSWPNDKIFNQQRFICKSLFSGFVSPLDSTNKGFQNVQNVVKQDQYTSFNNFCIAKQFSSSNQNNQFPLKTKAFTGKQLIDPNPNLFFCDDHNKGNLCNQISDGKFQNSIQFISNQAMILPQKKQNFSQQNRKTSIRNFTKKSSRQPQFINSINEENSQKIIYQEVQKNIKLNSSQKNAQNEKEVNQMNNEINEDIPQSIVPMDSISYFHDQQQVYFPSYFTPYYFIPPQQYPLYEYRFYKFAQYIIYYLMNKILSTNYYFQSQ